MSFQTHQTFVHRTGRTGRAGKKGSAILIYTHEQARAVRSIERDVGCKFTELTRIPVEGGSGDIVSNMGGRPGTYGGMGDCRYGDMSFGRSGGYKSPGSGHFGGGGEYGPPGSGRFGSYANRSSGSGSSRSGGFRESGSSDRSGGFGEFGRSNRLGGFGAFGRSDHSGRFEEFGGSDHSSRFGDFADRQSSQSGGSFVNSHSSIFGGSRNSGPDDNQNSGRRSF